MLTQRDLGGDDPYLLPPRRTTPQDHLKQPTSYTTVSQGPRLARSQNLSIAPAVASGWSSFGVCPAFLMMTMGALRRLAISSCTLGDQASSFSPEMTRTGTGVEASSSTRSGSRESAWHIPTRPARRVRT